MLQGSIPGVPGEDYPIYAEVPETGFSCDGQVDGGESNGAHPSGNSFPRMGRCRKNQFTPAAATRAQKGIAFGVKKVLPKSAGRECERARGRRQ
jgi:hypothetical protein